MVTKTQRTLASPVLSKHCPLSICAVAFVLAGCGGAQPPIGVPGAMKQASAITARADRGTPWMLPGTSSGKLIYATGGCGGTCVISYPRLKLAGAIPTSGNAICSDSQGNVFIPGGTGVTKYGHGGTQPIATLSLPGTIPSGCSVDPKTNNLAVVFKTSGSDIAVFPNEQGQPELYDSHIDSKYCGFDNKGNLFVSGYIGHAYGISELAAGSSSSTTFVLGSSVGTPGQIQWDGQYMAYESEGVPAIVSRLSISGSQVTVVGAVPLKDIRHRQLQSWIYNGQIIVPYNDRGTKPNIVGFWKYPKGGQIVKSIRKFDSYKKAEIYFAGVTVSVAPH
jgi:hypothetical protein